MSKRYTKVKIKTTKHEAQCLRCGDNSPFLYNSGGSPIIIGFDALTAARVIIDTQERIAYSHFNCVGASPRNVPFDSSVASSPSVNYTYVRMPLDSSSATLYPTSSSDVPACLPPVLSARYCTSSWVLARSLAVCMHSRPCDDPHNRSTIPLFTDGFRVPSLGRLTIPSHFQPTFLLPCRPFHFPPFPFPPLRFPPLP